MAQSIVTGSMTWVDGAVGNDTNGRRLDFDKPFLTIQAAINASVAGDAVYVRPGTYNELITCKDSVSVIGEDVKRCIVSRTAAVNENILTMAESMVFEGFTFNLNPTAGTTDVLFGGTSNATSTLRDVIVNGSGAGIVRLFNNGTATTMANTHATLDRVWFQGTGFANGLQHGNLAGAALVGRYVNCAFTGLTAVGIAAGTATLRGCWCVGIGGIGVAVGATVQVDASTQFNAVANSGTFIRESRAFQADRQTVNTNVPHVVAAIATTMLTLPAIAASTVNKVVIHMTCEITNPLGALATCNFRCLRDGVEILATDRYTERLLPADVYTANAHWIDVAPGAAPVYSIQTLGSLPGLMITNRRATCWI